jgi:hypothetical protein
MALGTQVRELVDAFSELVAQHVRLAKMELADDARFVGVRVGLIAAFAPLILVGYGFLCSGLALALGAVMTLPWAFVLVGVLNLVAGAIGIAVAGRQLGARRVLVQTTQEFESTRLSITPHAAEGGKP